MQCLASFIGTFHCISSYFAITARYDEYQKHISAPPIHLTQPLPGAVHCAALSDRVQRHLKVKKIICCPHTKEKT